MDLQGLPSFIVLCFLWIADNLYQEEVHKVARNPMGNVCRCCRHDDVVDVVVCIL